MERLLGSPKWPSEPWGAGPLGTPNLKPGMLHLHTVSASKSLYSSSRERNYNSISHGKGNNKGVTRLGGGESVGQFTQEKKGSHRGGELQLES